MVDDDVEPGLPPRSTDAHKGDMGRVLVIGGARPYAGAGMLTACAAQRAGAGTVTLAAPGRVADLQRARPGLMILETGASGAGLFPFPALRELREAVGRADVVAIGPGLGRAPWMRELLRRLLAGCAARQVLDADALHAFAGALDELPDAAGGRILTPHPGEAGRLLGVDAAAIGADRAGAARTIARRARSVCVLKGARTVVDDGARSWTCREGNSGLAVGGTGDVLAGVAAALLGRDVLAPFDAARLAVTAHARAADRLAARIGRTALTPEDLLEALAEALHELEPEDVGP